MEEAWREAGRDPGELRFSLMTGCVVARAAAEVEERIVRVRRVRSEAPTPEGFSRENLAWLVGRVDEVVERFRELASAGVDRVMLQHLDHEDPEMIEVLGRDVAPAVAA